MVGIEDLQPAAGLEGFEVWDRTVHAPEHQEVKTAPLIARRLDAPVFMPSRRTYSNYTGWRICFSTPTGLAPKVPSAQKVTLLH